MLFGGRQQVFAMQKYEKETFEKTLVRKGKAKDVV